MIEKLKGLADEKLKEHNYEYDQFFIEELVKKLDDESITKLCQEIEKMGEGEEEFNRVKAIIDETKEANIQRIKNAQAKDQAKREEKQNKKREWTKEEFALLAKALNKFPGGTPDRWKTIAIFMGDGYESKDIIEMAKIISQKKALITAGKGVMKKEPEKIIRSKGGRDEEKKEQKEDDGWNDEQQKQLEGALKKYPKTLPPKERWGGIASEVEGKTAKECLARFKYISALIKKKAAQ
jgi:DnaJ family protein C protein 2